MQYVIPFVGILVQKARLFLDATFAASARKPGRARITLDGPATPTGTVTVLRGRKRLAGGALKAGDKGRLTLRLPKLAEGKHKLTVKYAGSAAVAATKKTFTVTSR